MKKYLLLSAILVTKICAGQSTSSGHDTLCIPADTLRKVYTAALQKRAADSMNVLLQMRIVSLTAAVERLQERDSVTVMAYKEQISDLRKEQAIYRDQVNTFEKLLRREKRKRFWTSAGGVVATGLAIYLSTK